MAWRSLSRHKMYSILNIMGLGFGIACFLFISLYAIDEITFDLFHKKSDQIFRIIQHSQTPEEGEQIFGAVSLNAALAAREEIPGVQNSTRLLWWGRAALRNQDNKKAFYLPFLTSENSFFQIFDFPLIEGDRTTALKEPNSIVLSRDLALKLFGEEDALGKILESDRGMDLKVTGVFEDFPTNSHMQFESLVSHATLESQSWWDENVKADWSSQNWGSYLLLQYGIDPKIIGDKLTAFAQTRAREDRPFEGSLRLQALSDIHFGSTEIQRELNEGKSTYTYLYIFSLIGLFILGIACINYVNLATARSSKYSKEVGVRKVVGAGKKQLFSRFMSESFLLTCFSLLTGLIIVQLGLPWFNEFTEKTLSIFPPTSSWIIPLLAAIALIVSFVAGSYPAVYLSRFKPSAVLTREIKSKSGSQGFLRQGLVVLQFSLSILMIIGTLVAWNQMSFVQKQDLGFQKDQMIVVDINSGKVRNGFETILNGYKQLPDVHSVSVSSRVPGEWKTLLQAEVRPEGKFDQPGSTPWFIGVDDNFLETFGLDLIKGRNFDPLRTTDSTAIIINEKAAETLGIDEVAGQELMIVSSINNGSENLLNNPLRARVIGVVKDFNFQSLYEPIAPLVLAYRTNPIQSIDYFTVRISGQNTERTIAQMTDILHSVDPNQVFEYHFLDEQIATFYVADTKRSQLFTLAALCAIFIACLGLFGLAAFTAERRTKEIGIRKVLGASIPGIVGLLSRDFLKLVIIALLISSPLAYIIMERWLEDFAYRINIQWWYFILAGIVAVGIAFFTVSFQSIKAAVLNPVESLRSE